MNNAIEESSDKTSKLATESDNLNKSLKDVATSISEENTQENVLGQTAEEIDRVVRKTYALNSAFGPVPGILDLVTKGLQSVADESKETDRILEDLIKTTTGLRQAMESSSGILVEVLSNLKSSTTELVRSSDTITDSVDGMNNAIEESSDKTSKLATESDNLNKSLKDVATSIIKSEELFNLTTRGLNYWRKHRSKRQKRKSN